GPVVAWAALVRAAPPSTPATARAAIPAATVFLIMVLSPSCGWCRGLGVRAVVRPSPEPGCATIQRSADMADDPEAPQSGEPLIRPSNAFSMQSPERMS